MTLVRVLTCFKKTCKTLDFMEIITYKIPPGGVCVCVGGGGGGGGAK